MLKRIGTFLLASIMCFGLAACGNSETSNTNSSSSNTQSDDVVQLSVWLPESSVAEKAALQETLDAFNKEFEGKYSAELTYIPRGNSFEYENKVSSAATSNSLPDLMMVDGPTMASFADAQTIIPLTDYFTEEELSDFVPSVITQGTYQDTLYTLAPSESSVLLFYNKTMLDAAGITPPTELSQAWTWDDVYDAAKKLTKDGVYGINMEWDLGEGQIYGFAPVIWSAGSELVAEDGSTAQGYVNSDAAVQAVTQLQRFANENLMNLQPLPNDFWTGGSAMYLSGSWQFITAKDYPDFEYGVTFYPADSNTKKVISPSGDWSWAITADSKNPEAAAEFIRFFTSPEAIARFSEASGKPPARTSVLDTMEIYSEYPYTILKEQVLNTAHPRPILVSYPILSSEFASAMQDIRTGGDVKTSLDKVAERVDSDIARNQ